MLPQPEQLGEGWRPCTVPGIHVIRPWGRTPRPRARTLGAHPVSSPLLERARTSARLLLFACGMMMKQHLVCAAFLLLVFASATGPVGAMEGRAWGDIHVQTMDGATYDLQAAGEFVASRSTAGDLEVQLRLESTGFENYVSIVTAVAVLVDTNRASVALGREPMLSVEGRSVTLSPGGSLDLPDGGRIERLEKGYEFLWSDGSSLFIRVRKRHLNAFLRPALTRRNDLSGLFGNFNGNAMDDVEAVTAIGTLGSGTDPALNAGLAELARSLFLHDDTSWLVSQQTSLFEYARGQGTWTFRRPTPKREASVAGLPASWRRQARASCEQAGVTDPDLLEACIIDVGYTRDESFAETAAAVQARNDSSWESDLDRRPR